jgi:hypothetical protein
MLHDETLNSVAAMHITLNLINFIYLTLRPAAWLHATAGDTDLKVLSMVDVYPVE